MNTDELRYKSFEEFWPFYLGEHSKKGTRVLHFIGTTLLFLFVVKAILDSSLGFVAGGVVSSYGFAWAGHFFIEKNRPATFRYPFFSLVGDLKMCWLMLTQRLSEECPRTL